MNALPTRDTALTVLMTREEKARLVRFAVAHDLRLSQAARRILNERLAATESTEQCAAPAGTSDAA